MDSLEKVLCRHKVPMMALCDECKTIIEALEGIYYGGEVTVTMKTGGVTTFHYVMENGDAYEFEVDA